MTLTSLDKYGHSFQIKAIAALLSDRDFLIEIIDTLSPDEFSNTAHKWIIEEIIKYFKNYNTTISVEVLKIELKKLNNEILQVTIKEQLKEAFESADEDLKYYKEEFAKFSKNQKLKEALIQSVDLLHREDYDGIRGVIAEAMKAGEVKNIGHDLKKDIETRYRDDERKVIPFPWTQFNDITQGGYGSGDLVLILGSPGGGKSWTCVSMAVHAVQLGFKVVYYTLELGESYVGKRFDAYLSQTSTEDLQKSSNWKQKIQKLTSELPGELIIKAYPPRKVSLERIEAHLEQLKNQNNFIPDVIFIDYLDYVQNKSRRKERKEDIDDVYVGAKSLAVELQRPIISPSQVNRMGAKDEIIEGDKVAGSYDKQMIADISISLSRKRKDKLGGKGRYFFIKNRYGPDGMTFAADIDLNVGNITILGEVDVEDTPETNNNSQFNNNSISSDDKKAMRKALFNFQQ